MERHYRERIDCYGTMKNNLAEKMYLKIIGSNFMTPEVLFFIGTLNNFAEISHGESDMFGDIYGVTFCGNNTLESDSFKTLKDAINYAEESLLSLEGTK